MLSTSKMCFFLCCWTSSAIESCHSIPLRHWLRDKSSIHHHRATQHCRNPSHMWWERKENEKSLSAPLSSLITHSERASGVKWTSFEEMTRIEKLQICSRIKTTSNCVLQPFFFLPFTWTRPRCGRSSPLKSDFPIHSLLAWHLRNIKIFFMYVKARMAGKAWT